MTYALLIAGALLAALVAYRLWKLPQALAAARVASAPQALLDAPTPTIQPTWHMVFKSLPQEHNEHGFITTPMVPCVDPNCPCRTMSLGGLAQ